MSAAVTDAVAIVAAVHSGRSTHIAEALRTCKDPAAATIALACMVDETKPPRTLLAWIGGIGLEADLDGWTWQQVLDAHATYERYRAEGRIEMVPPRVREGERLYGRQRSRRRRLAARMQVAA